MASDHKNEHVIVLFYYCTALTVQHKSWTFSFHKGLDAIMHLEKVKDESASKIEEVIV